MEERIKATNIDKNISMATTSVGSHSNTMTICILLDCKSSSSEHMDKFETCIQVVL